jgi:nitronate monooxygenase
MQSMEPEEIVRTIDEIRGATRQPFAVNLWMPKGGCSEGEEAKGLRRARAGLGFYFEELGLAVPPPPPRFVPDLDSQIAAVLAARPPVFSFVFGVPRADVMEACRSSGILTMGTATTADEARTLADAGVDCIVASGAEAGGHKASFLQEPEESLMGTFALLPQIADSALVPIVAAGGVADARGVAAALALGAHGVQIGTAFLACDESAAGARHRSMLFDKAAGATTLTRAFTGRLARSLRSPFVDELEEWGEDLPPYPMHAWFVGQLAKAAAEQGRSDWSSLSAGQALHLVRHRSASRLMEELVRETPRVLERSLAGLSGTCAAARAAAEGR